jgi:hypothetical protein
MGLALILRGASGRELTNGWTLLLLDAGLDEEAVLLGRPGRT